MDAQAFNVPYLVLKKLPAIFVFVKAFMKRTTSTIVCVSV